MARYLLHSQHFIDGKLWESGEEIDFDGVPTPDMEGIDKQGKVAALAAHTDYFSDINRPGFVKHGFHLTPPDDSGEEPEEPKKK